MIAVDAMGGDQAPEVVVQGALCASRRGISLILFGDKPTLQHLLTKHDPLWQRLPITLEHCTQTIGMEEIPSKGVVRKQDSSLVRAIQCVAEGKALAVVSAGNSGAVLVSSTVIIGRLDGVTRPAIGGFIPTRHGSVFCLDLGANIDCKPEHLVQFALMGHAYVSVVKNIAAPRVALLSNGHEPYKGSALVKEAYELMQNLNINFVGNLEARDIFDNRVDVLVTDGFVGNVMLKTAEGTLGAIRDWVLHSVQQMSWWKRILVSWGSGAFKKMYAQLNYEKTGGALLLGVQKPVIVAHGCSSAIAIDQAIQFAAQVVNQGVVPRFAVSMRECSTQYRKSQGVMGKVRSVLEWFQG